MRENYAESAENVEFPPAAPIAVHRRHLEMRVRARPAILALQYVDLDGV